MNVDWKSIAWKAGGGIALLLGLNAYTYFSQLKPRQWRAMQAWSVPTAIAVGLLLVFVIVLVVWLWLRRRRLEAEARAEINRVVASGPTVLLLPRLEWPSTDITQIRVWDHLADVLPPKEHMAFELGGNEQGLQFSIHASELAVNSIVTQFRAEPQWRSVQRRATGNDKETGEVDLARPEPGSKVYWCEVGPRYWDKPVKPTAPDPLLAVIVEMSGLTGHAHAIVQVVARPDYETRAKLNTQSIRLRDANASRPNQTLNPGAKAINTKEAHALESRAEESFLQAVIRVAAISLDGREKSIARSLARTLCAQFGPSNPVAILREGEGAEALTTRAIDGSAVTSWAHTELAAIAHLVSGDAFSLAPQLLCADAKALPPSSVMRIPNTARVAQWVSEPAHGSTRLDAVPWLHIADYFDNDGNPVRVGMPMRDGQTHFSVVGATGSGKSTTLAGIAAQAFGLGATVYIQEPHGDLVKDAIRPIPNASLHKVAYLGFTGSHPPGISLLTAGLVAGKSSAVSSATSCLRVAEPASWDASSRMREVLRHALIVLLDVEGANASLIGLNRLLTKSESEYRELILSRCSEDVADSRDFWLSEVCPIFERERGGGDMKGSVLGAKRRVSIFLDNDYLRRSLACPPLGPQINMVQLLSGGLMILAPVLTSSTGLGPTIGKVVGTLLMGAVNDAFLSRQDEDDRRQAFFIMDELASMTGSELDALIETFLAQLRKFGASGVFGTQSPSQLPASVQKEFKNNILTKIVLMVSSKEDARAGIDSLATDKLTENDLMRVKRFHGYLKLMVDRSPQSACYVKFPAPRILAEPPAVAPVPTLPSPSLSQDFKRVKSLAKSATNPRDLSSGREVIGLLSQMDEPTWWGMVDECNRFNQYAASQLLADPNREPDKVQRAIRISNAFYGFPWYFREAYARRLRNVGKESPFKISVSMPEAAQGSNTADEASAQMEL